MPLSYNNILSEPQLSSEIAKECKKKYSELNWNRSFQSPTDI